MCILTAMLCFSFLFSSSEVVSKRTFSVFSVNPSNKATELNGRHFLVVGLRTSNALISDEKTKELVDNMELFASNSQQYQNP